MHSFYNSNKILTLVHCDTLWIKKSTKTILSSPIPVFQLMLNYFYNVHGRMGEADIPGLVSE